MSAADRLTRWRLILGGEDADGVGTPLSGDELAMDRALEALYDAGGDRRGGLGRSSPYVARWLGDIRRYFDTASVRLLQRDAIERLDLKRLLLEPELLEAVEPDVHLVATLLALRGMLPEATRDTARRVVQRVVDDLQRRLRQRTVQAVRASVGRGAPTRRPRAADVDWDRTIRRNLRHWLPEHQTLVPQTLFGHTHRRPALQDVVLLVDQSGSMASSLVYAGVFGCVLASLRSLRTRLAVFDTSVVDLTEHLDDPVSLLFGTQLGGGTDIARALGWCQTVVERPLRTVAVLISDLHEGAERDELLARAAALVRAGVRLVCLPALSDEGAPAYDAETAAALGSLGVPTFACTPELFPELMAAALQRADLALWAARHDVVTAGERG